MFKAGFLLALGIICAYVTVIALVQGIVDIIEFFEYKPAKKKKNV